ncbi:hypothetical protein ACIQGO_12960 [Streptomyces shenzhenensis]
MRHPYLRLPARCFWRTAVAEPGPVDITDLWTPKFAFGRLVVAELLDRGV